MPRLTVLLIVLSLAFGQDRLSPAASEQINAGANLPSRPLGPEDLVSVTVYGAPELSRTARVSAEGTIRLPMLDQPVEVGGRTPSQVEERVSGALAAEHILVNPAVTVTIAEYHSRPVSVIGAVRQPLTFPVYTKITLLEALARAQGLSADAGSEILITRPNPTNEATLTERVPVKGLIDAADPAMNLALEGGEEVRVPQIGRVFVVGNVRKPGGFAAGDTGMTVLKALALAEGLAPYSQKRAYIYRRSEASPERSQTAAAPREIPQEILVELRKILDRKAPDVNLDPNDILFTQGPTPKGSTPERYFHFDSWRVNVAAGEWVPSQIYVEEEASNGAAGGPNVAGVPHFKAQSRIWDYNAAAANRLDELTSILIDSESGIKDITESPDTSPLESQRSWERQAEDNIVTRLEAGGLLAPSGAVDDVLNVVVNNLIAGADLNVGARCRVLLTTPIETFSIGHTIVISRGLIDVLPDEASLAMVLAAELSHIALGHPTPTQYAFHNQTMLSDAELLQRFRFERSAQELADAGKKTIEIMRASTYQKTANAGLFLKALASRGTSLPRLLAANLGNQVANRDALDRLAEFAISAPALEEDKIEQIAALPLGSRVKLNPWNNHIELVKTRPLALLSPREKMPFEVTPFMLHLTRVDQVASSAAPSQP